MNLHLQAQITNMILMVNNFEATCKLASLKDDQMIDRNEEKILKKISAASQKFIKELESIK